MYTGSFSLIVLQFFANHTNFLCHFLLKTRRLKLEVRKYFEYKKKPLSAFELPIRCTTLEWCCLDVHDAMVVDNN